MSNCRRCGKSIGAHDPYYELRLQNSTPSVTVLCMACGAAASTEEGR